MALCAICGESAGFAKTHPACREALEQGRTAEEVRLDLSRQAASKEKAALWSATQSAMVLAGLSFPIIVVACALGLASLIGAKDSEFYFVGLLLGAIAGAILAAFFYNWVSMHALFARRVVEMLSSDPRR